MAESPTIKKNRGPARQGGGKRKNRSERRTARIEAAAERQAAYDALTDQQKLERARERGHHDDTREIRRLQWKLTPKPAKKAKVTA